MTTSPYLPLVEITRGNIVESIHFGAIAVVNSNGQLIASFGDPDAKTFLRSSAKPFQALPFVEHGGPEHYHLSARELALICSSHSGTDEHVAVVKTIQEKTGVAESDLMCGVHPPYHLPTAQALLKRGEPATPNRHNCSGKHTGMLAYTLLKQLPVLPGPGDIPYIDLRHPVQQDILRAFAEMCGLEEGQVTVGIDGCSVPTFAVPLRSAALAFARLCDPVGLDEKRAAACQKITAAITSNPDMIGGPDSFDTDIMTATHGKILSKGGAEGYQALGVMPGELGADSPGLGIILKISDGDLGAHSRPAGSSYGHARPLVAVEILRQLGILSATEQQALSEYGPRLRLSNWRNVQVGEAFPCFRLDQP